MSWKEAEPPAQPFYRALGERVKGILSRWTPPPRAFCRCVGGLLRHLSRGLDEHDGGDQPEALHPG